MDNPLLMITTRGIQSHILGYQAPGFPKGHPGYQRFPWSNYGNFDPNASASPFKPQGSMGQNPIPPQNLFGSTEYSSMDVDQFPPGLTFSHIILIRERGSSILRTFRPQ
jgi:hypothetical protein